VNVICFESCALYSIQCNIVLCERQFPLAFYGGTVSAVDCKFCHWVTCISERREMTAVFAAFFNEQCVWFACGVGCCLGNSR